MKNLRVVYTLLVLCTLVACSTNIPNSADQAQEESTSTIARVSIAGTLVSPTGSLVPNETIELLFPELNQVVTTKTDSHGVFVFDYLPFTGPFLVSAETHNGLYGSAGGVAVKSTTNASLQLKLFTPASNKLQGVVKDSAGEPQQSVFVTVVDPDSHSETTTISDANGQFAFDRLPQVEAGFIFAGAPATGATAAHRFSSRASTAMTPTIELTLTSPTQEFNDDALQGANSTTKPFNTNSLPNLNLSRFEVSLTQAIQQGNEAVLSLGGLHRHKNEYEAFSGHILALPDRAYEGQYAVYLVNSRGPSVAASGNLAELNWHSDEEPKPISVSSTVDDSNMEGVVGFRIIASGNPVGLDQGLLLAIPSSHSLLRPQQSIPTRVIARGSYTSSTVPRTDNWRDGNQGLWVKVTNGNLLGGQLTLTRNRPCEKRSQSRVILPSTTATYYWDCFTYTPVTWNVSASTVSSVIFMTYVVETTR